MVNYLKVNKVAYNMTSVCHASFLSVCLLIDPVKLFIKRLKARLSMPTYVTETNELTSRSLSQSKTKRILHLCSPPLASRIRKSSDFNNKA